MEKFVVLKNGVIYNLSSNKRLKIIIKAGDKDVDINKMSKTMTKFFNVMDKNEFMENWLLTLSLMMKEELDGISDEEEYADDDIEKELDRLFKEIGDDLEVVKKSVSGDDISNYVTAFVIGRLFGKFEKNTGAKVTIEYVDIEDEEHAVIENFMQTLETPDDYSEFDDDVFDGNAYFELDDFTED